MVFANREQATLKLLPKLEEYRDQNPLVLAIPRGGVIMGEMIVNSLGGELDLMMAGKISSESNLELAIGAVTDSGFTHIEEGAFRAGYDREAVERLTRRGIALLQERRLMFAPLVRPIDAKGRIVILVDDGIATGATMTVAVEALRAMQPARIILATPVASSQALARLTQVADEVIVLSVPEDFRSVSQFYEDFAEITDAQVIHLLSESRKKTPLREAMQRGVAQVVSQHDPSGSSI